jgi:hypothetical protein
MVLLLLLLLRQLLLHSVLRGDVTVLQPMQALAAAAAAAAAGRCSMRSTLQRCRLHVHCSLLVISPVAGLGWRHVCRTTRITSGRE